MFAEATRRERKAGTKKQKCQCLSKFTSKVSEVVKLLQKKSQCPIKFTIKVSEVVKFLHTATVVNLLHTA
jgi:hypothetical protein